MYTLEKGPAYAHPRRIVLVDEMPIDGVGKVDRAGVLEVLRGRLASFACVLWATSKSNLDLAHPSARQHRDASPRPVNPVTTVRPMSADLLGPECRPTPAGKSSCKLG